MIDTSNFECVDDQVGLVDEDDGSRISLINEAYQFIDGFTWCLQVKHLYLCNFWEGILAILFVEIDPRKPGIDDPTSWVLVGDIPPAYLDITEIPTPREALEVYLVIIEQWADAVEQGNSVAELMPMYVRFSDRRIEPPLEHAEMMRTRARVYRQYILPELPEI